MKKLSPTFRTLFTLLLVVTGLMIFRPATADAQDNISEILRAGIVDSNTLMKSYLQPVGTGFGGNLSTGWINSARPYRPAGFDLRVNAALSYVPSVDRVFDISTLNLSQMEIIGNNSISPTVAGEENPGAVLGSTEMVDGERLFEFEMPEGTGFHFVPSPMIQLTAGIPFESDISIRYFPTSSFESSDDESEDLNGEIGLWGLGIKHGLNQWLPGGDLLPVDLSVMAGFTKLTARADFDLQPETDSETEVPSGYEAGASRWENQGTELKTSAFTTNLLIGKTFPVLSLFAGVGYQHSNMNIQTPGNYPVIELNEDSEGDVDPDRPRRVGSIRDPIDLDLSGGSGVRALAGFRLRLAIVTISASYTLSKYPVANAGIGFSFR